MTEFPFLHLTVAGLMGFTLAIAGYLSARLGNLIFPFNVVAFSVLITCTTMSRFFLPLCHQPRIKWLPDAVAWIVGFPLFLGGIVIIMLAVHQIGLPAASTAPRRDRKLITTGIYSRLRNPIYLGEMLWSTGWAVLFKAQWALAVTPLWIAFLLAIALLEERRLQEEYGEEYERYRRDVPFITCWVF